MHRNNNDNATFFNSTCEEAAEKLKSEASSSCPDMRRHAGSHDFFHVRDMCADMCVNVRARACKHGSSILFLVLEGGD